MNPPFSLSPLLLSPICPSLPRGSWGRPFVLVVRYMSHHAHAPEDFELWTHTNECVAALRRHIMQRYMHIHIKPSHLLYKCDYLA